MSNAKEQPQQFTSAELLIIRSHLDVAIERLHREIGIFRFSNPGMARNNHAVIARYRSLNSRINAMIEQLAVGEEAAEEPPHRELFEHM